MNTLVIGECVRFGWETFKKRPWVLVGATSVIFLAQAALQILSYVPLLGAIAALVGGVYIGMGVIRFALRAHDAVEGADIKDLWAPRPFWRYLGAILIKGAIAGGPFAFVLAIWIGRTIALAVAEVEPTFGSIELALLIAGFASVVWLLFVSVRLLFVEYLVMDKDRKPVEALKESFRITKGSWWKLFLLGLLLAIVNLLGILAFVVGLLVSVPVSMLATVHAYRKLEHKANELAPAGEVSQTMPAASAA